MAISQTQIVDYLNKKVGYGVAKTDLSTAKYPFNESIASPLLVPGATVLQQDYAIPNVTSAPTSNTSVNGSTVVSVYNASTSAVVQGVALSESETNETWSTGITNWIPPSFGSGYQLKIYAGPPGASATTAANYTNLPVAGSGNNDSWFFDYQAGVLNFADTNVPTPAANVSNVVYFMGAVYTGTLGITNYANLSVTGNLTSVNGNIVLTNGNLYAQNLYGTFQGSLGGSVSATTANVALYDQITNLTNNQTYYLEFANLVAGNSIIGAVSTVNVNPSTSTISALAFAGGSGAFTTVSASGITSLNASIPTTGPNTGALQVPNGGAYIFGNLWVGGNINFTPNSVSTITGNSAQYFGNASGFGALFTGISSGYVYQSQTVIQASTNFNGYAQINHQNINGGSNASTDFIATADTGTAGAGYIDMGINSSGFVGGAGNELNYPLDGYVYVQGTTNNNGNLILSTEGATDVVITTNGQGLVNQQARFKNNVGLIIYQTTTSTSTTSGALQVAGGAGIQGAVYAGSIQNTPIGSTTASTGAFTTATTGGLQAVAIGNVTPGTAVFTTATTGGLQAVAIGNVTPGLGFFTTANATNLYAATIGNVGAVITGTSGTFTQLNSTYSNPTNLASANAVITGGSVNGTPIGATTASSGAFTTLSATGVTQLTNSTQASSTTTGALQVTGGISTQANLYVGGNTTIIGNLTVVGTTTSVNSEIINQTEVVAGTLTANSSASSTSFTSGQALLVAGGVGVVASAYIAGGVQNSPIGNTTPSTGNFTNLNATTTLTAATINAATLGNIGANVVGTGTYLTALNASNLSSGTVPSAQISGSYTGITQVGTLTGNTVVNNTLYAQGVYDNGTRVVSTSSGTGNLTISGSSIVLTATGPGATTVGSNTQVPVITTDAYGRVVALTSQTISTSFTVGNTTGTTTTVAGASTLTLAGTYGVTVNIGNEYANIATPQDLRTTANPSFASVQGVIGNVTPTTATFTTASTGGLQAVAIGNVTPGTGVFTTGTFNTASTGGLQAVAIGNVTPGTGVFTSLTSNAETVGGLQAVQIGNITPGGATFTTAQVNSTLGVTGVTTLTTANIGGLQVLAIGNAFPGTGAFTSLTGQTSTFGGLQAVAIGNVTPGTGVFTTLTANTETVGGLQAVAIGNVTPGSGAFTTGTFSSTLGVTGATTLTTATVGGLQAVAIGNVTPGSGAFTTLSTTGNLTVGGNIAITGNIVPSANVTYNLGTPSNRFASIYVGGQTIYVGGASIGSDSGGNLTLSVGNGNQITLVNAQANNAIFTGNLTSPTFFGNLVATTINATGASTLNTVTGASLQATAIGNVTPGTAVFTTATTGGLQAVAIGNVTPGSGAFTTGTFSSTLGVTGATTMTTATTGGLQAVAIGNVTPGSGAFTTLTANTETVGGLQAVAIGNVTPGSGAFTTLSTSGAATLNSAGVTNNATVGGTLGVTGATTMTTATTGGLQAVAIGNVTPGTGVFTTLSGGATTVSSLQASAIGNVSPGTGAFSSLNATTMTVTSGILYANAAIQSTSNITGALQIPNGGLGIANGNLYVGGTGVFGSSINYTPANAPIQVGYNINNYSQFTIQNANSGNNASTDIAAVANNGSDNDTYVDMGIVSSGYSQAAYSLYNPNDGYLIVAGNTTTGGGNLILNTYQANDIIFATGGTTTQFEVARITHGNTFVIKSGVNNSNSANTGALQVWGGASISGNVYYGGVTNTVMGGMIVNHSQGVAGTSNQNAFIAQGYNDSTLLYTKPTSSYDAVIVGGNGAGSSFASGAKLVINSTDTMLLPSGTNAQRPSQIGYSDTAGMFRYSTTSNSIEWYNGSTWQSATTSFTVVQDQQFSGTDSQVNFTLSQTATTNGIIVSINGIMQIPTLAYSVSGTTLTFTEAPQSTDVIDVRLITTTATVNQLYDSTGYNTVNTITGTGVTFTTGTTQATTQYTINTTGAIASTVPNVTIPTASSATTVDSFFANTYSTAKYVVTSTLGTVKEATEILVISNGTVANIVVYGTINTAGNSLTSWSAVVSGGTVQLQGTTTNNNTVIRMTKQYNAI
jgi:hypothetical protein